MNLVEPLLNNSLHKTNGPLFIIDGEEFSSSVFWNLVGSAQKQMARQGIKPRVRVGICSGRGIQFFVDLFALIGIGARVSVLDSTMTESALTHSISLFAVDFTIGMEVPDTPCIAINYTHESTNLFIEDVEGKEIALVLFTSGSTGLPKGVPLTHGRLLGNIVGTLEKHFINSEDRLAINLPFRFVSAISHTLSALMTGACLIGSEKKLMPREFLAFLKGNDATAFGGAPIQIRTISEAMKHDEDFKNSIKWVMSSGDHLPPEVVTTLFKINPKIKVIVAYGLTELAGRFFMNPLDINSPNKNTLGTPIAGLTYMIADDDSQPTGSHIAGEVIANGDLVFDGYLQNNMANEKAFTNQYFRTGDLGYKTEDGDLVLTGRCSDVFKVSGLKVATQKLCATLMESSLFEDVAVFPFVDNQLGTIPYLLYVSEDELSLNQVLAQLRNKLPSHYMPRKIKRVKKIPRTGSGKIKRDELSVLAGI